MFVHPGAVKVANRFVEGQDKAIPTFKRGAGIEVVPGGILRYSTQGADLAPRDGRTGNVGLVLIAAEVKAVKAGKRVVKRAGKPTKAAKAAKRPQNRRPANKPVVAKTRPNLADVFAKIAQASK